MPTIYNINEIEKNFLTTGTIEIMEVGEARGLSVSPSTLNVNFTRIEGRTLSPRFYSVNLTYYGDGEVSWSASSNNSKVTVSPSSGTLTDGQTVQVTVTVSPPDEGVNEYSAIVTFSGTVGGNPVIPATLVVNVTATGIEIHLFLRGPSTVLLFAPGVDDLSPGVVVLPTDRNPSDYYDDQLVPDLGQRQVTLQTTTVTLVPYITYAVSQWTVRIIGRDPSSGTKKEIIGERGEGNEVPVLPIIERILEEESLNPPYWVVVEVILKAFSPESPEYNSPAVSSDVVSVPVGRLTFFSFGWSFRYQTNIFVRYREGTFRFRYIAGVETPPILYYQRHRIPEESWELVFRSPTNTGSFLPLSHYLSMGKLRYFRVLGGVGHFLIVTTEQPFSLYVLSVVLDPNNPDYGETTLRGIFPVLAEPEDDERKIYTLFGAVAEGHGGVVYVTHRDAIYIPFELDGEILRVSLLSEQYPQTKERWGIKSVLTVPEGFLFLPEGILWDIETYWNFKVEDEGAGGQNDRVVPFYTENFIGYIVRTGEYGNNPSDNVTRAYVWGGVEKGIVKIQLEGGDRRPIPFYLGGGQLGSDWVAFSAVDHWEESVLVAHKVVLDPQNPSDLSRAKLTLSWKGRTLPLPFSSPVRQGGVPPGWWEEWLFSLKVLNNTIYFGRLWERIYKYNPSAGTVTLAHIFPNLYPDGTMRYSTEEEVASLHLSLDETTGKLYGCRVSGGGIVQIWRQQYSYVAPPAPEILFPSNNLSVPKKFDVEFRPGVDERPQEFALEFIAIRSDTGQKMILYYDSRIHRSLFFVSTDNGVSYSPMTGPLTVTTDNQGNLRVKFTLPVELPPSVSVTIRIYSIVPTP